MSETRVQDSVPTNKSRHFGKNLKQVLKVEVEEIVEERSSRRNS